MTDPNFCPESMWTTPQRAAGIAGVTPMTIVRWCSQYGIGHKVGGRWRVSLEGLEQLLVPAAGEAES